MVEPVERDSRGILHPRAALERFALERFAPSAAVARFVDRYWVVSWHLPDGQRHEQQVLVHPVVNIVFERDTATVTGVQVKRFTKVLTGRGRALGVMFRPAGFRPLLGRSVSTITGAALLLAEVKISNSDPRLPIPPVRSSALPSTKRSPRSCPPSHRLASRPRHGRQGRRTTGNCAA
jgi:hypothetical protein